MKETGLYPIVSDHAVLRYLERCHGLNVEVIRARSARASKPASATARLP